jgi:WD40 repeat protein
VGEELAYWKSGLVNGAWTNTLRGIRADGSGDHALTAPLKDAAATQPAWSPDGKTLAFVSTVPFASSIVTVPASGGSPHDLVVAASHDEALFSPSFSADGKRIAYMRYPHGFGGVPAGPDQLVVRVLATGAEKVVADHAGGRIFMEAGMELAWSADSERVAFVERENPTTPGPSPVNRVVTVLADGTGQRRVLMQDNNGGITGLAWANAPRSPSYYIRNLEIAQAIAQDVGSPLPFDPLQGDPYTYHWEQGEVAPYAIPLVAGKRTLVRIYVGGASLPKGTTQLREVHYRVTGDTLGTPVEGDGVVDVGAPDTPFRQASAAGIHFVASGALNVWLPAEAAMLGVTHLHVEINADAQGTEVEPECTKCFPNGNRADVDGIRFVRGGVLLLQQININIDAGKGGISTPFSTTSLWPRMLPLLPVGDADFDVIPPTPVRDEFTITTDELTSGNWRHKTYWACEVALSRLHKFRLLPGKVTAATQNEATHVVGVTERSTGNRVPASRI